MNIQPKQLLLPGAIAAVLFFSSFLPESSNKQYLTVRVVEFLGGASGSFDSKIVIVDEKGRVEEFEMGNLKPKTYVENTKLINETLNKVAARGYELSSSTNCGVATNYVFEKK